MQYSDIISDYEIIVWDDEPTSRRFKASIIFSDGSVLMIKDYLFPSGRKYAYHWQDAAGGLIMRWDNAPHWKEIDTYPHHRHEKSGVFSSSEVTLEDILEHISESIQSITI